MRVEGEPGWVGSWSPGIGDPTVMGWVTVAAYAGATVLCAFAARGAESANGKRSGWFWLSLAVVYLLLGINKQLDLQSLLTEIGRISAHAGGWYEQRRVIQLVFIAGVIAAGAVGWFGLMMTAPWRSWPRSLALLGTTFLIGFVIVRAASFNRVDALLGTTWLGMRGNWLLELPGILLTAGGAAAAAMGPKERAANEPGGPRRPSGPHGDEQTGS